MDAKEDKSLREGNTQYLFGYLKKHYKRNVFVDFIVDLMYNSFFFL